MMKKFKNGAKGVPVFLLLLFLWWLACEMKVWSPYVLPAPQTVWHTMIKMLSGGELMHHIAVSMRRVFIGFGIAFFLAFGIALANAAFPKMAPWYSSLLNAARHIPPLSLVPLLILWFGIGETPKIIVIVLAAFFPVLLNADAGLAGCDKKLLEVGEMLRFSKIKKIFAIMLPNALPDLLVGMRLGLGNSLRAIVGSEMIAAASGIGYLILDAEAMSRTDKVLVGILFIGLIGLVIDGLFRLAIRLVSHGRREVST